MASGVNFGTQQYFGFDPRTIPGCALWLDAADSATLTLSGSSVTAWADKSGNGRNAVGTTSNPTYNATGFNSRPTVTFSNNILTSSNWSLAPNRQFAWFLAVHVTSTSNIWHRILVSATGGYPNGYLGTHSNTFNFLGIAGSTTVTAPIATGTTNPQLVTYLFGTSELSANTTAVSVNGGTFSTLAGNTGGIGTSGLSIGSEAGGAAWEGFLGHLSEVICYNSTVTQLERQQVEGYLAWKWGLQARPPATHPFKLAPPIMRAFQPMDVSGASLWLDAADPSTLSFSGPNVTQWRDKSGTGNHYATGGAITYSNQALVFPGNATMSNTNPINFSAGTTPSMTTFVVVSTPDGSAERGIFQYGQISCSKTGYAIYVYTPSEVHCTLYCGDLMVRNAITTNTPTMVADVVTYSGTPGSLSRAGWINGAAMTTTNVTTTGVNLNLASSSVIGNVAGGFWNGTMNEILYFNRALSTAERQEIEGYLATKWNLPVRVPTTHPFRNVLPSTPLFSPPQLSGLSLWIDAADATTFTLSGSNVTQCTDKSGQGYVLTVPGGYTSPVYSNGVLAMSGSNALWSTTNFAVSGNTQVTTFLVGSITSIGNPGPGAHIGLAGSATPPQYFGVLAYQDGGQTILYTPSCFGPDADRTLTPNINGQRYLLCAFYNGTVIQGTYNGTLGTSQSLTTANFASRPFQIGMRNANTGGANDGTICESICYTGALTASQRQQVEGYLAWKWGLQARLPSTHPFARFRP
jgi:hypothetical protein